MSKLAHQIPVSPPDRNRRPDTGIVFVAAIAGFLLAGNIYASFGVLAFSLLAGWAGWLARGLA